LTTVLISAILFILISFIIIDFMENKDED